MAEKTPDDIAKEIDQAMESAAGEVSAATLREIGEAAVGIIATRTKSGLDADRKPFTAYSKAYALDRQKAGLSTTPDLARTGNMIGAIVPEVRTAEVALRFLSAVDEVKAIAHNEGVDKTVFVRPHRRETLVNLKTGQRVSRDEARKDKRRKNPVVGKRSEAVAPFQRRQHTPKREFFDVRADEEVTVLEDAIMAGAQDQFEKVLK